MNRWCVGVDFGRQNDRTAIAAIEVTPVDDPGGKPFLDLRYLTRRPIGETYPSQCAFIAQLVDETEELQRAEVIVDSTGVGIAVSDSLRESMRRSFTELSITGGNRVKQDGSKLSVPKRDLISRLGVVMQSRRLRVARDLPDGAALYAELQAFSVSISDSGADSYAAKSGHDDLVLAVSYAVWLADERPGSGAMYLEYMKRQLGGNVPITARNWRDTAAALRVSQGRT